MSRDRRILIKVVLQRTSKGYKGLKCLPSFRRFLFFFVARGNRAARNFRSRFAISNTNRDAASSQMIGYSESTNHASLTSVIERRVISTWCRVARRWISFAIEWIPYRGTVVPFPASAPFGPPRLYVTMLFRTLLVL